MAELKPLRILDTSVLEGRLNIAIGQAIVEARQAGPVPDTLRFLRFPPHALVGRHQALGQEIDLAYCAVHGIGGARGITRGGGLETMIYMKCNKCFDIHNTSLSHSFSTCGCGGQMKLIRVPDEQHRKAVSALQESLNKLVTSSLERVQEMIRAKGLSFYCTYEDWSENWLLKNSDARSCEGIEHVCSVMAAMRDANEGDEIFDAADWAVITADAAERAVSGFEKGNVYDMLWWVVDAVNAAEAVKALVISRQ